VDYEVATPLIRQERKVYHINLKKWNASRTEPMPNCLAMVEDDESHPDALCAWDADLSKGTGSSQIEAPGLALLEK